MSWLRPLSHFLDYPTEPVCPAFCCYRQYCSNAIQRGINPGFVSGKLKAREDCFFFQGLAELTREELGVDPPATAEAFLEIVAEREGMKEAS